MEISKNDKHDCKLRNIIPYKGIVESDEARFAVTIPVYQGLPFGGTHNLVTQVEARLKRKIISKLEKNGMDYESYSYNVADYVSRDEIHIGSPMANNRTAREITELNVKQFIPAVDIAKSACFENYGTQVLSVVEITGLCLELSNVNKDTMISQKLPDGTHQFIDIKRENRFICRQAGDSYTVMGPATVRITGQAEIRGGYSSFEEIEDGDTQIIQRIIEINKDESATISCLHGERRAIELGEGADIEIFGCKRNEYDMYTNDYAIVARIKRDSRFVHLLFGSKICSTEFAVRFLLNCHDHKAFPSDKSQYFLVIPLTLGSDVNGEFAEPKRDESGSIVVKDCINLV